MRILNRNKDIEPEDNEYDQMSDNEQGNQAFANNANQLDLGEIKSDALRIYKDTVDGYSADPKKFILGLNVALANLNLHERRQTILDLGFNNYMNEDWGKPRILISRRKSWEDNHLLIMGNVNLSNAEDRGLAKLVFMIQSAHETFRNNGFFANFKDKVIKR